MWSNVQLSGFFGTLAFVRYNIHMTIVLRFCCMICGGLAYVYVQISKNMLLCVQCGPFPIYIYIYVYIWFCINVYIYIHRYRLLHEIFGPPAAGPKHHSKAPNFECAKVGYIDSMASEQQFLDSVGYSWLCWWLTVTSVDSLIVWWLILVSSFWWFIVFGSSWAEWIYTTFVWAFQTKLWPGFADLSLPGATT